MIIKKIVSALFTVGLAVAITLGAASPAHAAAGGSVTCNGEPVVGVWIEKVSGSGSSGWAWTPNNGSWTQPYYRENISSSATFNVHVGCGGTPSNWKYTTRSIHTQSSTSADWVCFPGYASGHWHRCWPS
jgi:hypothetical protein